MAKEMVAGNENRSSWPQRAKYFAILPQYFIGGNGRLAGYSSMLAIDEVATIGGAVFFVAASGQWFFAVKAVGIPEGLHQ